MSRSRPPFHKQETPYSYVPACLRIVLLSFNQDIAEARLRALCDCTVFGTSAGQAVEAAHQLGFPQTGKYNLTIRELTRAAEQGELPIVFVSTLPLDGIKGEHSLVVLNAGAEEVAVYDPLAGERLLPRNVFEAAWATMRNLTILIRQ